MDYSLPGSSLHGILLARILEWVDISSSRESSRPRNWTHIFYGSCIGRQILYHWATWEAQVPYLKWLKNNRNLFLTVPEAGSLRSRCQHGQMGALHPHWECGVFTTKLPGNSLQWHCYQTRCKLYFYGINLGISELPIYCIILGSRKSSWRKSSFPILSWIQGIQVLLNNGLLSRLRKVPTHPLWMGFLWPGLCRAARDICVVFPLPCTSNHDVPEL